MWILLLPLLALLCLGMVWKWQPSLLTKAHWGLGATCIAPCYYLLNQLSAVRAGQGWQFFYPWLPSLNLHIAFRLDGLAWVFSLLVLGMGGLIVMYARYYLHHLMPRIQFYWRFLCFMLAMLGVVLADNLLLLGLFWELTSLFSALFIAFNPHKQDARQSARIALFLTGGTGLVSLFGLILLGEAAGTYQISALGESLLAVQASPYFSWAFACILLGALTKSAQFPLHFWLPQAMSAPTPASAYLHSATMVNLGLFLLFRLHGVLGTHPYWTPVLVTIGATTLLFGALLAVERDNIKSLLAYSTVSHLGLITLLLGINQPFALLAAFLHLLNHAIFKAALFMAAGMIDHETGTRELRLLRGLRQVMPITAILVGVAAAAMAGLPLLNGFLSKEMLLAAVLESDSSLFLLLTVLLATIASVVYALRLVHAVFFGETNLACLPNQPHEPPRWMRLPMLFLVLVCLLVGILPQWTVVPILRVALQDILPSVTLQQLSISAWHGLSVPFLYSLSAWVVGIVLYSVLHRYYAGHPPLLPFQNLGRRVFMEMNRVLRQGSTTQVAFLESLGARGLIMTLFCLWTGLVLGDVWQALHWQNVSSIPWQQDSFLLAMLTLLALFGAGLTIRFAATRMVAVIVLGLTGLMLSLLFVLYSSPDLALTQICVEILTTLLFILALCVMPLQSLPRPRKNQVIKKTLRIGIALSVGVTVAGVLCLLPSDFPNDVARYYMDNSLAGGGGRNMVNVIIVDFRGFDTFIEMTVFGLTGLILLSLLASPVRNRITVLLPERSILTQTWAGIMSFILLLFALFLLLRGHNAPGGGFIAGLVVVLAYAVQYLSLSLSRRLIFALDSLLALGFMLALLTGLGAMVMGANFLTSTHYALHLAWLGEIELASAALFDLGVFFVVVAVGRIFLLRFAAWQAISFTTSTQGYKK